MTDGLSDSAGKYDAELKFWAAEIDQYVWWYNGKPHRKEMYGIPCPTEKEKIRRHTDVRMNALETWVNADKWRYCKHLFVEPTYWSGKVILEVGCGPLMLAQWFFGAGVIGLDPLISQYMEMGYQCELDGEHPMQFIECSAEKIALMDDSMDAAFSVNAIDHVDNFKAACAELERVVKPDGEIRIEVHYHAPTTTEPHSLNDEIVRSAFKQFDMRKIQESPSARFYPPGTHPASDRFALWGNRDYLYPAVDVLK